MASLSEEETRIVNKVGSDMVRWGVIPDVNMMFDAFSVVELQDIADAYQKTCLNRDWVVSQLQFRLRNRL